ncbi:MAG: hypothetical protein B7Z73_10200, partial [Planctomycetia bacterium 21-64-5]
GAVLGGELRLVVRSGVAPALLARAVKVPYELRPGICDTGVAQTNSITHDALQTWLKATIVSLFAERVVAAAGQPAIHFRAAGSWRTLSWREVADDVRRAAAVLASVGVQPGDRVVQFSPNRYEWIVADLAIQHARAVHVPVHASLAPAQVAYQIADCGAKVVLLAGPDQAASLLASGGGHREPRPSDIRFVSYDPCPDAGDDVACLRVLMLHADASLADRLIDEARRQVSPDDLATILYTSGTTGEPKGVMLSQRNLATNALGTLAAFGTESGDLRLAWLPMSHIFARTCDVYTWLAGGGQLALPNVTSYVSNNTTFQAYPAGSLLDLSALTSVTQTGSWTIQPYNGGKIKLSSLTSLTSTKGIAINEFNSGSSLDLSSLTDFSGGGGTSSLRVTNNSTLYDGSLVSLSGVAATLDTSITQVSTEGVSAAAIAVASFPTTDTASDLTASVNWGDGDTTGSIDIQPDTTSGKFDIVAVKAHAYADESTQTATVTVHDTSGNTVAVADALLVVDAPLSAQTLTIVPTEGAARRARSPSAAVTSMPTKPPVPSSSPWPTTRRAAPRPRPPARSP